VNPDIHHFYHAQSGTFSYVVSDAASKTAAVIDPVLGFSIVSGRTDKEVAGEIVSYIEKEGLTLEWILETHAHADHISAAQFVKARLGGKIAIGEGIRDVQAHFGPVFNLQAPFAADGHQFDHLFGDDEKFALGEITCSVMRTPGHTNDSVTYLFGNAAFVGDTLFMTDLGTARCDFPGGDAGVLYDSIQKLFALPDETMLYLCHDYPPDGRGLCCQTSVGQQKEENIHVGGGTSREDYVRLREARDAALSLPTMILPSLQVNIEAGRLPQPESNEITYIKIPVDTL
jgi:glyoxylase-like metal-dependent hydrolase (beta-lactamase superfamily II)